MLDTVHATALAFFSTVCFIEASLFLAPGAGCGGVRNEIRTDAMRIRGKLPSNLDRFSCRSVEVEVAPGVLRY